MRHILLLVVVLAVPHTAMAGTIWHWTGFVTGHTSVPAGLTLDSVVPIGTPVDVIVSLAPDAPALNPAICLQGMASATMRVLGRSYTNTGYVWEDAMGFGPGTCAPSLDNVEIVVPSWGSGGPALPDGWIPLGSDGSYLPGMWWGGDLADGQPAFISAQFPLFHRPGESWPQRFRANLQAVSDVEQPTPVPEPATMTMVGVGLALAARTRLRRHRNAGAQR
ncbi:MAG: PEP-CTERM sorting domain-containing protein [Cyanobacteria bacterium]|nr:PEP-CTERM sorting domain-containing protein [Cyanobacteriota bacterium]